MGNTRTYQDIKAQEYQVFSTIPGMNELLQTSLAEKAEVEAKYPDAVFAVVIAPSLFNHNRELSEITQKAYFAILDGENIASVRFAYDKATDEYWKKICGMIKKGAVKKVPKRSRLRRKVQPAKY